MHKSLQKHDAPIVTVFGGTGFLGRYVVWRLARQGYTVRIPTRDRNRVLALKTDGAVGQVVAIPTQINSDTSIARAIQGADCVINLVGILFEKRHRTFDKTHAEFPARLGRLAMQAGAKTLIHISALGADLNAPSHYARSKAEGEINLRQVFPAAIIMRPSVLFGAEDNFINQFAKMARLSPILPLIGGGTTRFQPVYVADVADAIVNALTDESAIGKIYELGGPSIYSFEDLLRFMMDRTEQKRMLFSIPFEVMSVLAIFFELLPNPLLTRDQIKSLKTNTVSSGHMPGLRELGVAPTALEPIAETYLARYRPGGRFANLKTA